MNQSSDKRPNFFARCWNGQARLWQAFWLCGVFGKVLVVSLLFVLVTTLHYSGLGNDALAYVLVGGLFPGWFIFASVSVWRCAGNVSHALWGVIAKVITILAGAIYIVAAVQTF